MGKLTFFTRQNDGRVNIAGGMLQVRPGVVSGPPGAFYVLIQADSATVRDSKGFCLQSADSGFIWFQIVAIDAAAVERWQVASYNQSCGRVLALFGLRVQRFVGKSCQVELIAGGDPIVTS